MGKPLCSDEEFMELFRTKGSLETAKVLGTAERCVFNRRKRIEKRLGEIILPPKQRTVLSYPARLPVELQNGIALIASDCHYWPGVSSPAHRGFIHLCKELSPSLIILNGDVIDGASISRHSPLGWENKPKVHEELEAAEERLEEITKVSRKAKHIWTVGNHDQRFDIRLASQNSEFESVKGMRLTDHFPSWDFAMSVWINNEVVVKHRFKGGIHATHNNALWAGKTTVTGHLHSLKVTPFNDYNGTRWGVDTGTLSDPYGAHADYAEDNPLNHRSGFVVLTFHKGSLLWPEIVNVISEQEVCFRGKTIQI